MHVIEIWNKQAEGQVKLSNMADLWLMTTGLHLKPKTKFQTLLILNLILSHSHTNIEIFRTNTPCPKTQSQHHEIRISALQAVCQKVIRSSDE